MSIAFNFMFQRKLCVVIGSELINLDQSSFCFYEHNITDAKLKCNDYAFFHAISVSAVFYRTPGR